MSALCLSNSLVAQYLKYLSGRDFDKKITGKLLKYIQPFLISSSQHIIFKDPSALPQLQNDPLIHLVDEMSDEDLVKYTTLKLQLVDKCNLTSTFTEVNVMPIFANSEKVDMSIGATYENATGKDKAIRHITALLSDAKYVNITDGYIAENPSQWNENKNLLNNLLPKKAIEIAIITDNFTKQLELENLCSEWKVKIKVMGINIHDRYIETDKIKILLSSGLYNLSIYSQKDFTYMVKIKDI